MSGKGFMGDAEQEINSEMKEARNLHSDRKKLEECERMGSIP